MKKTVIMFGFILVWACSGWSQEPEIGWEEYDIGGSCAWVLPVKVCVTG